MTSAEKQHLQTNKALRPEFFTAFGNFFFQSTATVPFSVSTRPPRIARLPLQPCQAKRVHFREKSLITKGSCNVLTVYVL